MVEDTGLEGDLHRMLDERNIKRLAKERIVIRQRVRDALDELIIKNKILTNELSKEYIKGVRKAFDLSIECCKFGSTKETVEALKKYANLTMDEIKANREDE